jgi:Mg-chelatase subunit ChlD
MSLRNLTALVATSVIGISFACSEAEAAANVLFIFDASGSMNSKVETGETRLQVAKSAVAYTLKELPSGTKLGLMLYGHRRSKDCSDIELVSPIGANDASTIASRVGSLRALGETPIADALQQALHSFAALKGQVNRIVLVTDGIEECNGDPCAAAQAVRDSGLELKVDIVGFTLNEEQRKAISCVADITGGQYYEAKDVSGLKAALAAVKQQVAANAEEPKPPPAPTPPTEAPRKVVFSDEFNGSELSGDWDVANPNPDEYVVDKGKLTIIASGGTPGDLTHKDVPNVFRLKKELPSSDWTITVKLNVTFATETEELSFGVLDDESNMIVADLFGNVDIVAGGLPTLHIQIRKISSGKTTLFSNAAAREPSVVNEDRASYAQEMKKIAQPITLKLIKEGREYRAAVNLADQKDNAGKPIFVTTDPVSSIRPPKTVVINASQSDRVNGETSFDIDSVTIDVPADAQ